MGLIFVKGLGGILYKYTLTSICSWSIEKCLITYDTSTSSINLQNNNWSNYRIPLKFFIPCESY
ncbi:hypothetical protein qdsa001_59 [Staphylococcus phage qdsa001]|nr:hypothetical protein qdsa001_59 [Staphylococcus phage qdsa001]QYC52139.1 hypothetical protein RP15_gp178 [Staphylococcus phage vB_Sau-RP15]